MCGIMVRSLLLLGLLILLAAGCASALDEGVYINDSNYYFVVHGGKVYEIGYYDGSNTIITWPKQVNYTPNDLTWIGPYLSPVYWNSFVYESLKQNSTARLDFCPVTLVSW